MNTWTTKEGIDIPYSKLKDSHLLNIIKWVEDKAEHGITLITGTGGWDLDSMDYWEEDLKGNQVLKHYRYVALLEEAKKRKII
jgi:hypothetical protein